MSKRYILLVCLILLAASAAVVLGGSRPVQPRTITRADAGEIDRAIKEVYQRFGQYISMGYAGLYTLDASQKSDTVVMKDRDGRVIHFKLRNKFAVVISPIRRASGSMLTVTMDSLGIDLPSSGLPPSDSSFAVTKKWSEEVTINWVAMER